jgi:Mn2+/Fe2+ NRAMP family transporter
MRGRRQARIIGPSKPRLWQTLGPGLITGAADDDPSGIATYAALVWAAVLNGVVSVPVMVMVMLLGSRADVMGKFRISPRLKLTGWIATIVMATASVVLLCSSL